MPDGPVLCQPRPRSELPSTVEWGATAGGWYGKNNWESKGQINHEDTAGFVGYAMRKLRMELTRAETT